MTNRTEQPSRGRASRVLTFTVFALIAMCVPGAASAQWATSGTNISNTNTGNVGVGTPTPSAPLHVFRDFGSGNSGTVAVVGGKPFWSVNDYERLRVGFTQFDSIYDAFGGWAMGFRTGASDGSGVERLRITSGGNVGIGTTTPSSKLEVVDSSSNGVAARFIQSNPSASNGLHIQTQTASTNDLSLLVSSNAGVTIGLAVRNNGSVGVGTSLPNVNEAYSRLTTSFSDATAIATSVENTGTGQVGHIIRRLGGTPARWYQYIPSGSTDLRFWHGSITGADALTLQAGGNVGIGTTSPATKLDVADSTYNGNTARFVQSNTGASNGVYIQTQTASANDLALAVTSNAGATMGLAVRNTGNVGVGTASPAAKLHVAGDIKVDGNINAKYQDVAEWVPSTQKLSAGTVVVLDPERPNHVLASKTPYDTAVAGVVSDKPGLTLGEAGEGKALVATTGRVKVRVDATRGAIRIGDLIVTSEVEGVAMKSEPVIIGGRRMHAPGTIIGKALGPLAGGTGEILILLSLQ